MLRGRAVLGVGQFRHSPHAVGQRDGLRPLRLHVPPDRLVVVAHRRCHPFPEGGCAGQRRSERMRAAAAASVLPRGRPAVGTPARRWRRNARRPSPCCVRMVSRRWPGLCPFAGFHVFGDSASTHPAPAAVQGHAANSGVASPGGVGCLPQPGGAGGSAPSPRARRRAGSGGTCAAADSSPARASSRPPVRFGRGGEDVRSAFQAASGAGFAGGLAGPHGAGGGRCRLHRPARRRANGGRAAGRPGAGRRRETGPPPRSGRPLSRACRRCRARRAPGASRWARASPT